LWWLLQALGTGTGKGNSRKAKEEGRSTSEFTEGINTHLDVEPVSGFQQMGRAHMVQMGQHMWLAH